MALRTGFGGDRRGRRLDALASRKQVDLGAGSGEPVRDRPADATACTRHEHRLAGKVEPQGCHDQFA